MLLIGGIIIYLNIYYKASKSSYEYLKSSNDVKVVKIDDGYFFDGPSEEKAIIFYPGAKVESEAYAKLMYNIALNGYDCFLLNMLFRIAFLGSNKASNIMNKYEYDNYYLAGHSMGGVVAANYVYKNSDNVKGLLLLASYSTKKIDDEIKMISIYGDKDGVLNMNSYKNSFKYNSKQFKEVIIPGGNHANFGDYGFQKGDNESDISMDEQIAYVVHALTFFD